MSETIHFKGPGEWRRKAAEAEGLDNETDEGVDSEDEHESASSGPGPGSR